MPMTLNSVRTRKDFYRRPNYELISPNMDVVTSQRESSTCIVSFWVKSTVIIFSGYKLLCTM